LIKKGKLLCTNFHGNGFSIRKKDNMSFIVSCNQAKKRKAENSLGTKIAVENLCKGHFASQKIKYVNDNRRR
jgi:hypothetical protein